MPQVCVVKTAIGGTTVSAFDDPSANWTAFKAKTDAAFAQNPTLTPILFYSQGINDAIAGTNIVTWKSQTIAHFAKIRARYGANMPIIWSKLPTAYAAFNTAIDEIAAIVPFCYTVETFDLPYDDPYHLSYAGLKTNTDRKVSRLLEHYTL